MIYELRTYTYVPGKAALARQLWPVALRVFPRHGIRVVGSWEPIADRGEGDIVYLLAHPSEAAAQAAWDAFRADPEWVAAAAVAERDGGVLAEVASRMLRPTAWSPLQ